MKDDDDFLLNYRAADPMANRIAPASDSPNARALREEILMSTSNTQATPTTTTAAATPVGSNTQPTVLAERRRSNRRRSMLLAATGLAAAGVAAVGISVNRSTPASAYEKAVDNTVAAMNRGTIDLTIGSASRTSTVALRFDGDNWEFRYVDLGAESRRVGGVTYAKLGDSPWSRQAVTDDQFGPDGPTATAVRGEVGKALQSLGNLKRCADAADTYCGSTTEAKLLNDLLILDLGEPDRGFESAKVRVVVKGEVVERVTIDASLRTDGSTQQVKVEQRFSLGAAQQIEAPK